MVCQIDLSRLKRIPPADPQTVRNSSRYGNGRSTTPNAARDQISPRNINNNNNNCHKHNSPAAAVSGESGGAFGDQKAAAVQRLNYGAADGGGGGGRLIKTETATAIKSEYGDYGNTTTNNHHLGSFDEEGGGGGGNRGLSPPPPQPPSSSISSSPPSATIETPPATTITNSSVSLGHHNSAPDNNNSACTNRASPSLTAATTAGDVFGLLGGMGHTNTNSCIGNHTTLQTDTQGSHNSDSNKGQNSGKFKSTRRTIDTCSVHILGSITDTL